VFLVRGLRCLRRGGSVVLGLLGGAVSAWVALRLYFHIVYGRQRRGKCHAACHSAYGRRRRPGASGDLPGRCTRWGGGGRGGGFAFRAGSAHLRVVFRNGTFVRRQGLPIQHPLAVRNLRQQRFASGFNNGVGVWPGLWGDWWPGGDSYPVQQAEAPVPAPPQIALIHSGDGGMATAEATPLNVTLIPGCHAIANGYHCDNPRTE
jgi:hypothetical protein